MLPQPAHVAKMGQLQLAMVAAMTLTNGIGKDGGLPWRLKGEMAYFRAVTTHLAEADRQGAARNVVIMGRKTWTSIPPKFRPLGGRLNLVISRTQTSQDLGVEGDSKDVRVFTSVQEALNFLASSQSEETAAGGRIFVIGGAQLYTELLELHSAAASVDKLLVTRILAPHYDCDAHFPEFRTRAQFDADLDLANTIAADRGDAAAQVQAGHHLDRLLEQPRWTKASSEALRDFLGAACPAPLVDSPNMVTREGDTCYQYQLWMRNS